MIAAPAQITLALSARTDNNIKFFFFHFSSVAVLNLVKFAALLFHCDINHWSKTKDVGPGFEASQNIFFSCLRRCKMMFGQKMFLINILVAACAHLRPCKLFI